MLKFSEFGNSVLDKKRASNFRMAGDAFNPQSTSTNTQNNNGGSRSSYDNWMSFIGGLTNEPSVRKNPSPVSSGPAVQEEMSSMSAGASRPAPINDSGIDFSAWAEDTVNNGKSSGQDADYWEETYRKNYNDYLANKAIVDNHQGPGSWDEFNLRDQSHIGTTADRNQATIEDYGDFTDYMTAKQGMDHWEKYSSKWIQ